MAAKGTLVADVVAAETAAGLAPCIMGTLAKRFFYKNRREKGKRAAEEGGVGRSSGERVGSGSCGKGQRAGKDQCQGKAESWGLPASAICTWNDQEQERSKGDGGKKVGGRGNDEWRWKGDA